MHTLAPWTWRWDTSCSLNVDRPVPTLHQWTRQLSRDALSSHCNSYPSLFHTFWGLKTRFRASWPQLTPGLAGTTKALRVPGTWTVPPGSPFLNSNLPGAHGNETDSLPGALPGGKSSSAQLLRQGRRGIAGRCDFFFSSLFGTRMEKYSVHSWRRVCRPSLHTSRSDAVSQGPGEAGGGQAGLIKHLPRPEKQRAAPRFYQHRQGAERARQASKPHYAERKGN